MASPVRTPGIASSLGGAQLDALLTAIFDVFLSVYEDDLAALGVDDDIREMVRSERQRLSQEKSDVLADALPVVH